MKLPVGREAAACLFVLAMGMAAAPAHAQFALWTPEEFSQEPFRLTREPIAGSVSLSARFLAPFGDVATDVTYDDLFDPGVGIRAEYAFLFRQSEAWQVGGYFDLAFSSFPGADFTSGGLRLTPDDMHVFTTMLGFKGRIGSDAVFTQGHFGFGFAYHPEVEAEVDDGFSITGGLQLFKPSTTIAFEVGLGIGFRPAPRVAIFAGGTFEWWGAPREGADFVITEGPRALIVAGGEVGVAILF